jgi:hypothetical protein
VRRGERALEDGIKGDAKYHNATSLLKPYSPPHQPQPALSKAIFRFGLALVGVFKTKLKKVDFNRPGVFWWDEVRAMANDASFTFDDLLNSAFGTFGSTYRKQLKFPSRAYLERRFNHHKRWGKEVRLDEERSYEAVFAELAKGKRTSGGRTSAHTTPYTRYPPPYDRSGTHLRSQSQPRRCPWSSPNRGGEDLEVPPTPATPPPPPSPSTPPGSGTTSPSGSPRRSRAGRWSSCTPRTATAGA